MKEVEKKQSLDELLNDPFASPTLATQLDQPVAKQLSTYNNLAPEYQEKAQKIAEQIDYKNQQAILQYGVAAQSELSQFSQSVLQHVQTKDTGPVGDVIADLMSKIRQVNPDDFTTKKKGFISRVFSGLSKPIQNLLTKYQSINVEIDKIADKLERSKQMLYRDITMLDSLYDKNKQFYDALNIYIGAAEYRLETLRNEALPALQQEAKAKNDYLMAQEVNDLSQFINRLEKRVHDLKLSRQIAVQSAPQIRLIQEVNQTLVEKIQSSILTAIPLWKNQIVIATTLLRQKAAMEAQKQVSKTTNDLLTRNSEMLKQNTIEVAKENERGIVNIETLRQTQSDLITTLEEVLKIQEEGRTKRTEAEAELYQMEADLKTKLMDLK
ncbi:toxic anion resistance protein [Priestia flexa]|uniref:Tellurite resistance protein TelA n=1 Tax=Priestia veravalensis TaxID=1414648 RepID=A0A0V8JIC4_9BACI|nr:MULTISPECIES: toxic anion resistance protein [Bacillaceae]KSU86789.1 tellurite resistance protein TelA [Priestia veravalensis]KZB90188.1 tellurite resistance protein TelA [Bacillus sp. VT 712]MBY6087624.1 toxic anion resistance protein [Priestia flexa]MCA1201299.1 toxic anion resistance protein [Priestia flexa]MCM3065858.1 toxic anion resistance protein [Priestia flexa]